MKTDAGAHQPDEAVAPEQTLDHLLRRSRHPVAPKRADGMAIGRLSQVDETGDIRVDIDAFGLASLHARAMITLTGEHVGQPVVLGFESSDPQRPIVLGLLLTPVEQVSPDPASPGVHRVRRRCVVNAEEELELRCGDAVILLEADGHITIRGVSITSHASAVQRLRGGSVQIN